MEKRLGDAPTYTDRDRRLKKIKVNSRSSQTAPKSRKKWRMALRAPVRDSRRVYRAVAILSRPMTSFNLFVVRSQHFVDQSCRLPEAARNPLSDVIAISSGEEVKVTGLVDIQPVPWPDGVVCIAHTQHASGIELRDEGAVDWCGCVTACTSASCANSICGTFCSNNNYKNETFCGNRRRDVPGIVLRRAKHGLGVFTTQPIKCGTVVGEFAGVLVNHDYTNAPHQGGYTMTVQKRSTRGEVLSIEAAERGLMIRFANHACNAKCLFFEVDNRRRVAVLVVDDIPAGVELTVNYGDEHWFDCTCGASNCVGPRN